LINTQQLDGEAGFKPDWPAPAGVEAWCSIRQGGVSRPPYDSLNLGQHVGDDVADTAVNRSRFAMALGAQPVFLNQVHHWDVCALTPAAMASGSVSTADACFTQAPGLACTIMVADCLPVLLCSTDGAVVGAAHAGWRGLLGEQGHGVLEALLARMREQVGLQADWLAWLGPCIGPLAFEVGSEVRQAFVDQSPASEACFRDHSGGKYLANLPALARQRLQALGVHAVYGNDGTQPWCTVNNPSVFFSHRRDRVSGRFAAAIWRCAAM
jgi:YfiH family protein